MHGSVIAARRRPGRQYADAPCAPAARDQLSPLPPRLRARPARGDRGDVLAGGRPRRARAGGAARDVRRRARRPLRRGRSSTKLPDRQPGSAGDSAAADLVAKRFDAVPAGAVSEQRFDGRVRRRRRRRCATSCSPCPGDGTSTIVVAAARDSPRAPAAASSAAATGVLLELADALGERQHERTFVLASTSGSATGATGMRELLDGAPGPRARSMAVIVISQPGVGDAAPAVRGRRARPASAARPVQLERTAEQAVDTQTGLASRPDVGLHPARAAGDPVRARRPGAADRARASTRSRSPRPASGRCPPTTTSSTTSTRRRIDAFGRAIQSTVGALDVAERRSRPRAERPHRDRPQPGPGLGAGRCSRWR